MAFKRYLDKFPTFSKKDLPSIVLWDKFLVYATVFGNADKVAKTLEKSFTAEEIRRSGTSASLAYFASSGSFSSFSSAMSSSASSSASPPCSSPSGAGREG